MENQNSNDILVTGIGITSAIGQGKEAFYSALIHGRHRFDFIKRPGRQKEKPFIGAEILELYFNECLSKKMLRTASFSGQAALVTLKEAWDEANLDEVDPERIGLIIGGSNFQQRELIQSYEQYSDRIYYIRPVYGISFMDSDLCGLCTEQFGIRGLAYTTGGASASGQVAILQAVQAVRTGQVDVCIAMGALMDLSFMELHAFKALGAMGTDKFAEQPEKACRPFDKNHDGFIYGESCGVVVIESADLAKRRKATPYALISGWSMVMDGNRNPNPSLEGECKVIQKCLKQASLSPNEIDYINPHGTGSSIGDETELKAIQECRISHAYINTTKSITGHGLSSAGAVEAISTLLQMKESKLHPSRNLEEPIDCSFNWVKDKNIIVNVKHALNLSMGFGGINTAICLTKI